MTVLLPHQESPAALLAAHYRAQWEAGGQEMAEINPALAVEAIAFTRYAGDWLGVVIAPWFVRLFLLPGGGSLWGEIPLGQSRYLSLPSETMRFMADEAPEIGCFQFSTLLETTSLLADMAAARQLAERVMQPFGYQPAVPVMPVSAEPPAPAPAAVSRRGFFRRLAGKA